jgi:dTDP-4-amino-4,6-dideoxygalactose transaminase
MQYIPHSKPVLADAEQARVHMQIATGMLEQGTATAAVEAWFAARYAALAARATGSGSQALMVALRCLGAGPGTEVVIPTYVCPDVMAVVEYSGAHPVLVDSAEDYLPDEAAVAAALSTRTRAIVFPYLYGIWRSIDAIRAHGVPVIEDCAHFIAPDLPGGGIVGDLAIFSFKTTKLVAAGEGGLVLTRSPRWHEAIAWAKHACGGRAALNLFPLSDLNATLLNAQLERLDEFLAARRRLAERYLTAFADSPALRLDGALAARSIHYRLPLRLADPGRLEQVIADFAAAGIVVRRPLAAMCHQLRAAPGHFPMAERLFSDTISLPLYPALSPDEIERIVSAGRRCFARG